MSGSLMASAAPVKETPVGGETWLIASSASGMEMMAGLLVVAAAGMARALVGDNVVGRVCMCQRCALLLCPGRKSGGTNSGRVLGRSTMHQRLAVPRQCGGWVRHG